LPRNDARQISARKYSPSLDLGHARSSWRRSGHNAVLPLAHCCLSRWAARDRLQAACHDRDTRASSTAHRHILIAAPPACGSGPQQLAVAVQLLCCPLSKPIPAPCTAQHLAGYLGTGIKAPLSTFHFPLSAIPLVGCPDNNAYHGQSAPILLQYAVMAILAAMVVLTHSR
jgi:hypothetical protein